MARLGPLLLLAISLGAVEGQKDPHFSPGRDVIVHLFEWKFSDIAKECETFIGPKGYGGIQVSPVTENVIVTNRPWWERYQPVSYKIATRSGNEDEFKNMVHICNNFGVRIFVDVVFNHMAADRVPCIGTGGSECTPNLKDYPGVPYTKDHFHDSCPINYSDPNSVRNCELSGLHDLDQNRTHVKNTIISFLNHLLSLGVAGFRIDGAKHMWPGDLDSIYKRLRNLTEDYFVPGSKPFIYQAVIDMGGEPISRNEYTHLGLVTEFRHSFKIGQVFRGKDKLTYLDTWGPDWDFIQNGSDALVFVDNHDNQRGNGPGGQDVLTYKMSRNYKMAIAFMLAHPYGVPRILSSYFFEDTEAGPPSDINWEILSPGFNTNDTCTNGWVCEHRWRQIYDMVYWRVTAKGTKLENWWTNGDQQIAFSRGKKAFIAFTNFGDLIQTLQTGLPAGVYCDIVSGKLTSKGCSGKSVTVKADGTALIEQHINEEDGFLAIHVNAKFS